MKSSTDTDNFWTGIADVTSDELPVEAKGAVYRVVTFASDYEAFFLKVSDVLADSGDTLTFIEEPEQVSHFLRHSWVKKDHEVYEMMVTADKNKGDVV